MRTSSFEQNKYPDIESWRTCVHVYVCVRAQVRARARWRVLG
jgi:hypothetical protein